MREDVVSIRTKNVAGGNGVRGRRDVGGGKETRLVEVLEDLGTKGVCGNERSMRLGDEKGGETGERKRGNELMTPASSSSRRARRFRRFSSCFSFPGIRLTTRGGRDLQEGKGSQTSDVGRGRRVERTHLMISIAASPNLRALKAVKGRPTKT